MDKARKAEPRANKLLYEAELRHRREMHEKKLRAAKPSVQSGAPKGFGQVRAIFFKCGRGTRVVPSCFARDVLRLVTPFFLSCCLAPLTHTNDPATAPPPHSSTEITRKSK